MKELRVQHKSKPYRILYAFDPRRVAILLIGGNKSNDKLWYETFLPLADKLFQNHLEELQREVAMAKSFRALREAIPTQSQQRIYKKVQESLSRIPLAELRKARSLTQEQLAQKLAVKQASVSKIESQTDMYISTMRKYIEAMGGELEITAIFPDGSIRVERFETLKA